MPIPPRPDPPRPDQPAGGRSREVRGVPDAGRPGRAGRLGRRAQVGAARVLGYLSALLAVVGVVTLAKGSPVVGGLLLLAAFVLVAVAYALVRSVARRSRSSRR